MSQSTPLRFEELAIGDTFIAFPSEGDNGIRKGFFLFQKTSETNALRSVGQYISHMPTSMPVLRIIQRPQIN